MASTINATTASGGGVITTADASGVLQLQTGGTTAVTVDASQNVGIGTASPNAKLHVSKGSTGNIAQFTDGVAQTFLINSDANVLYAGNSNAYPLAFTTAGTERMRIDTNGQNTMTTTIGYAQLRNVNTTTVATGGTVDFPSMSGILIVNNHSQGSIVIFSCGGGLVSTVNTNGSYGGTTAYVAGINGYRWTANSPAGTTHTYTFTLIATRPAA